MRKPPKSLMPLIELAQTAKTSVADLVTAARSIDTDLLARNAFHVFLAIPDKNDSGIGLIKFAAIHHLLGTDSSVFASIADTCARGQMADTEAALVLEHMLKEDWMPRVPGPLFGALAHGKTKCAELLNAHGFYRVPGGWGSLLHYIEKNKQLQMAMLLVEIVNPPRDDLLSLRTAAESGSDLAGWLDSHLGLLVVNHVNSTRH